MPVAGTASGQGLAHGTLSAATATATVDTSGLGGARPAGSMRLDATRFQVGTRPPYTVAGTLQWQQAAGADRAAVEVTARDDEGAASAASLTLARSPARTEGELRALTLVVPKGANVRSVASLLRLRARSIPSCSACRKDSLLPSVL